jgi:hypothetical protein
VFYKTLFGHFSNLRNHKTAVVNHVLFTPLAKQCLHEATRRTKAAPITIVSKIGQQTKVPGRQSCGTVRSTSPKTKDHRSRLSRSVTVQELKHHAFPSDIFLVFVLIVH